MSDNEKVRSKRMIKNPRLKSFLDGTIKHSDIRKTYTTGQIARVLDLCPRTVSKMIDRGDLKGYRIPSSEDRRVCHDDLLQFLKDRGLPQYDEMIRACIDVVLLVGCDDKVKKACTRPKWVTYEAQDGFTAGGLCERYSPEMVIVDMGNVGKLVAWELGKATFMRNPPPATILIAPEDGSAEEFERLYLKIIQQPVAMDYLVEQVEGLLHKDGHTNGREREAI